MAEEFYPELEETVSIHDRDFQRHSIEQRIYCVPVDETEEDRVVDQHEILYEYFEQTLFFPPVEPEDVLDCGCGPAPWAAHVARELPDCEVIGLDIFVPPLAETEGNLRLLQWDLNHPFRTSSLLPESFDLVHSRLVAPGIDGGRWVEYVSDLVKLSKQGGWVQLAEFDYIFQSDSGLREEMPALNTWVENYRRVMEDLGRDPRIGRSLQTLLRMANLVEIQSFPRNIPIGGWPTGGQDRQLGLRMQANVSHLLEAFALWPFTALLGIPHADVADLIERARQEMNNTRLRLYLTLYVAFGQRRQRRR